MPNSAPDALNDCNILAVSDSDGVIIPTHELLENGGGHPQNFFFLFCFTYCLGVGVVR